MASKGSVFNFMRGGQLFFSFFAMTVGVIKKNFMMFVYAWMIITALGCYYVTTEIHRDYGVKWALSSLNTNYFFNGDVTTEVTYKDGRKTLVPWKNIESNQTMKNHWISFKNQSISIATASGFITFFLYGMWFFVISRFGEKQSDDSFIRGAKFATEKEHNKLVKKEEKDTGRTSNITIAGYKLPPKSDNTHILLLGAPSVGKTATIIEYLQQVRSQGGRCFIYDRNGDFTKIFYREGVDIILNPNDARTANWTVWSEGYDQLQYRTISKALIPDVGNDPFWSQAARLVFESLCKKIAEIDLSRGTKPSMEHLMTVLLRMDDEKMASILKGTDAGSVFNMNSEKMAASIRSTLTTYIEPLKYMQRESGQIFSFKNWVESDSDSWIFIPVKASEIDLFKPLITVWAEQYSKTILERSSDSHKQNLRFNLVIDELASLQKLTTLDTYLSEARKFGGNALLGTQSSAQIQDIYGNKGAEKLTGSIGNYVIFRNNSPDGAEWSSKLLMKEEIQEVNDNLTVGHADVRDSLNMNKNRKERVLVTPSEIVNLPDLQGYIRFGRGYGLLKFTQKYPKYEEVALPFMPMDKGQQSPLDELDEAAIASAFSPDKPQVRPVVKNEVHTTNYVPQYGTTAHKMAHSKVDNDDVIVGITAPSEFMDNLRKKQANTTESDSSEGVPVSKENTKEAPKENNEKPHDKQEDKQQETKQRDTQSMFTRGL
ncbi:TPA: type IV secretion system DNA-binding domain-containing protein [Vibrio parahaemolyticus]